jgi:hypothetical protein
MRLEGKMHQIPHGELEMRPWWVGPTFSTVLLLEGTGLGVGECK